MERQGSPSLSRPAGPIVFRCGKRTVKDGQVIWRCPNMFAPVWSEYNGNRRLLTVCPKHAEMQRKSAKKPAAVANRTQWRVGATGKAWRKRNEPSARKAVKKWQWSDHGKAYMLDYHQQAWQRIKADAGLKMNHMLRMKLATMAKQHGLESATVAECTGFASSDEFVAHLEETFDVEGGMNWDNHGKHDPLKPPVWNIGHRIAVKMFSASPDDMRKCWSKANIFAQWAEPNIKLGVRLPPDAELLALKECWPSSWSHLPTIKERVEFEGVARNSRGSVRA